MNRLFYTCRNVTGMFSKGLLCNMKILENSTSLDFLTPRKTDKSKEYIEEYLGIKIDRSLNLFGDFYLNTAMNMANWKEVYDALDVSELKHYDALHIFGGLHFPQSKLTRFSSRALTFPNDRGQMKFKQTGKNIINVMAIHKAHVIYDIPLHEFSYDSDEMCSSLFNVKQNLKKYNLYHLYDMPQYGMKRLDSLQYYLISRSKIDDQSKDYDFTFGYTVFPYGNREHYVSYVDDLVKKFDTINLYVKNNVTGEDNSIDRDVYLNKIAQSRYTLIIPSYDNNCFSLYRFIESIYNDCLPLIHKDCHIADVEKSYDVDLSELVSNDVFDEDKRLELLSYLKSKFLVFERSFV